MRYPDVRFPMWEASDICESANMKECMHLYCKSANWQKKWKLILSKQIDFIYVSSLIIFLTNDVGRTSQEVIILWEKPF